MGGKIETKWEQASSGSRHSFRKTTGQLTIVTDLTDDEIADCGDVFKLSCSSSSIPDMSAERDDIEFESGCAVVSFAGLCLSSTYTLKASVADGEEVVVFSDVSYRELAGLSEEIDDVSTEPW